MSGSVVGNVFTCDAGVVIFDVDVELFEADDVQGLAQLVRRAAVDRASSGEYVDQPFDSLAGGVESCGPGLGQAVLERGPLASDGALFRGELLDRPVAIGQQLDQLVFEGVEPPDFGLDVLADLFDRGVVVGEDLFEEFGECTAESGAVLGRQGPIALLSPEFADAFLCRVGIDRAISPS